MALFVLKKSYALYLYVVKLNLTYLFAKVAQQRLHYPVREREREGEESCTSSHDQVELVVVAPS